MHMDRKAAVSVRIVPVPASNANGYRWQWRSLDGAVTSTRTFGLFYECLEDARTRGHEVELPPPPRT